MRKRCKPLQIYLSETEATELEAKAKQSGLSRSAYVRALINGKTPQPILPEEFVRLMNEVSALKAQVTVLRDELLLRGQSGAADQLEQLRQDILQEMRLITAVVGGR